MTAVVNKRRMRLTLPCGIEEPFLMNNQAGELASTSRPSISVLPRDGITYTRLSVWILELPHIAVRNFPLNCIPYSTTSMTSQYAIFE